MASCHNVVMHMLTKTVLSRLLHSATKDGEKKKLATDCCLVNPISVYRLLKCSVACM